MKDNLKHFIESNRDAFDDELPAPGAFNKILITERKFRRGNFISMLSRRWAAVAAGFILLGGFIFIMLRPSKNQPVIANNSDAVEEVITGTDPAYARQISQFREMIGLQQEELMQLKKNDPALYNQFSRDMTSLDSAYRALKDKLADHPNRETLLEAMIQNLQLQSDLLSRQLLIIRQNKQKNNSHEKTRI